jgi:hypothetical protein
MPVRTFGVDWAVYQSKGNHALLRKQGADFIIAKVSQDVFAESFGDNHIRAAKAVGLIPGAYHFFIEPGAGKKSGYRDGQGGGTPEQQAAAFVRAARAANGGTLRGLICAVDLEALNETSMDGRTRKITSRPKAYHIRAFVREFHRLAPGQPIVVYTTASYLRTADMRKWTQPVGLWLAHWSMSSENLISSKKTGIPESRWQQRFGGLRPSIIQYQSGSHGGRAGGVWSDLCASNLTRAQLVENLTLPKAEPGPVPAPDPDPILSPVPDRVAGAKGASLRAWPGSLAPTILRADSGQRMATGRTRTGTGWEVAHGEPGRVWLEVLTVDGDSCLPPLWVDPSEVAPLSS